MISYDSYQNRILKVAKVKNFIVRFKFLFIGALALIVAATTGLLVTKGMVTSSFTIPSEIVYGDDYAPEGATAFLSSVGYEYSLAGSGEWSEDKPVKAGKYLARAVTSKIGGKGYGDEVPFEIVPREAQFTIGANSVKYGEVPTGCTLSNLVKGDRLDSSALTFAYDDPAAAKTEVNVDADSIKIIGRDGEDYTSCYAVTAQSKELTVTNRNLTLTPARLEYEYRGADIDFKGDVSAVCSSDGLAAGDTVKISGVKLTDGFGEVSAPKNAAVYGLEITDFDVINKDGVSVKARYDCNLLANNIIVNAKPATATTSDITRAFNALPLSGTTPVVNGLISGHTVRPDGELPSITDVGSMTNGCAFTVVDENGEEVTSNYSISYNFGTLSVTPYIINVTTSGGTWVYDGGAHFADTYNSSEVLQGFTLTVVYRPEVIEVSDSCDNYINFYVSDSYGNPDYGNFQINVTAGKLIITRRPVNITTGTDEKIYDGAPLSKTEAIAESESVNRGLLSGHHLDVDYSTVKYVTEASSAANTTRYFIYSYYGDVTANYQINYTDGTLTVSPRKIIVRTVDDGTHVYDGKPYSNTSYTTSYGGDDGLYGGIVDGEILEVIQSSITYVTHVSEGLKDNVCDYSSSGNYDIVGVQYGKISVQPRRINVVTTDDYTHIYDGTPYSNTGYTATNADYYYDGIDGLVSGDKLTPIESSITYVTNAYEGTVLNYCEYSAPSDYAIVNVYYGYLQVQRRQASAQINNLSAVYGEEINYDCSQAVKSSSNFVASETLEVTSVRFSGQSYVYREVGEYTIYPDAYCITGSARGIENYDVTFTNGTLSITVRPLNIVTGDGTWIYDGGYHSNPVADSAELLSGHVLEVQTSCEIKDVQRTENAITYTVWESGREVTHNYNITYTRKFLEVTPRDLSVTLQDLNIIYGDDESYPSGGGNYLSQTGLVDGEILEVFVNVEKDGDNARRRVGNYLITLTDITINGGSDGVKNYTVTSTRSHLTVSKRPLHIWLHDLTYVYGEAISYPSGYGNYLSQTGLLEDESIYVSVEIATDGNLYRNVGSYAVTLSSVNFSGGTSIANNYDVTSTDGTLKVVPRPLTVETADDEKVYDGTPLSNGEPAQVYFLDGGDKKQGLMLGGEKLTATYIQSVTDAGTAANACEYSAPNANYTVYEVIAGELKVTPRPLTVKTASAQKIYDGAPLSAATPEKVVYLLDGVEYKGLILYGETLICSSPFEIINVGKADNAVGYTVPNDNYEIVKIEYGVLEVTQKSLTVTISAQDISYGEDLSVSFNAEGLVGGESFSAAYLFDGKRDVPVEVGSYTVTLDLLNCKVFGATELENGISNYKITSLPAGGATFDIGKRAVTLTLLSYTRVYGEDVSYPDGAGNYLTATGILDGEEFEVSVELATDGNTYRGVGSYAITLKSFTVNGSADGAENYQLTVTDGTLIVISRPLTVETADAEKVYDGTALSNSEPFDVYYLDGGTKKQGLMLDSEYLTATYAASRIDKGEEYNACLYSVPNGNYTIDEYIYGTILITARTVYFESASAEKEYDGTPLTKTDGFDIYTIDLATGIKGVATVLDHTAVCINPSYITDVGEIDNLCDVVIKDGNGVDVSGNYDIVYSAAGTLKITPRQIKITTYGYDGVYDGLPHKNLSVDIEYIGKSVGGAALVNGDTLSLEEEITVTDAGSVKNELKFISPVGIYGNDDYKITYGDIGTLTVEKADLTVTLESYEQIYSGEPAIVRVTSVDGLVNGESFTGEYELNDENGIPATNVGEYKAKVVVDKCTVRTVSGIKMPATRNYNLLQSPEDGATVKITPRALTVTIHNAEAVYGDDYSSQFEVNGLADGHSFTGKVIYLNGDGEEVIPKNVSEYKATLDLSTCGVTDGAGRDVTKNYTVEISAAEGVLNITPRPLDITLNDLTSVYGEEVSYPDGAGNYFAATGLVNGETLEVIVEISTDGNIYRNVGTYDITLKGFAIDGSADGAANYVLNAVTDGVLTVIPRPLTVETADAEKTYDGAPLSNGEPAEVYFLDGDDKKQGLLLEGEYLTATYIASRTDAGTAANDCIYSAPNANYTVYDVIAGTLTVNKAPLTVTIEDGKIITYGDSARPEVSSTGLISGETLEAALTYSVDGRATQRLDAGEYVVTLNALESKVSGSSLANGILNYEITSLPEGGAAFTVEKAELTVNLTGEEKTYDGEEGEVAVEVSGLLNGETLIGYGWIITDGDGNQGFNAAYAGTYYYNISLLTIQTTDGYAFAAEKNYNVTCLPEDGAKVVINPAPLTVTVNDIVATYGDSFSLVLQTEGLQGLDRFEGSIIYLDKDGNEVTPNTVGEYTVTLDSEESDVTDVNGNSVKGNYEITVTSGGGVLTIVPREAYFKLWSFEVVYGEKISVSYEAGNFISSYNTVYGDEFKFVYDVENDGENIYRNVGVYDIACDLSLTEVNGSTGYAENYVINITQSSTLHVTQRRIVVETAGAEKEYDGTPLFNESAANTYFIDGDGVRHDGGLVLNHAISFGVRPEITDVGEIANVSGQISIVDPDDPSNDVSGNYLVDLGLAGTLKVTPRQIKITTYGYDGVYDGLTHKNLSVDIEYIGKAVGGAALVDGDTLYLPQEISITNAGSVKNELKFISPVGIYGYENYKITYGDIGTLTVAKAPLTVTIEDGKTVTYGEDYKPDVTTEGLVNGETITIALIYTQDGKVASEVGAGVYNVMLDRFNSVVHGSSLTNGIANYEITQIPQDGATLTVNVKSLKITLSDLNLVYGEAAVYPKGAGNYLSAEGLEEGDYLEVFVEIASDGNTYRGVGSYAITLVSFNVNGADGTLNYLLESSTDGVLTVTPRPLTVETADAEKVYDGTPLSNGEPFDVYYLDGGVKKQGLMLDGEKLTATYIESLTDAGEIDNACLYSAPNGNYTIAGYEYGTLIVSRRKITVESASAEKEYDGTPLSKADGFNSYYLNPVTGEKESGAVLDHEITFGAAPSITDVGEIDNVGALTVKDGAGNDVSYNYITDAGLVGILKVTPRQIKITTYGYDGVYDGKTHKNLSVDIEYIGKTVGGAALVNGDALSLEEEISITDVGSVKNALKFISPVGVYGYFNYQITYGDIGTLTVTQAPLSVTLAFDDIVYGEEIAPDVTVEGMAEGESFVAAYLYDDSPVTPKNAGEYSVSLDIGGCNVLKNGFIKAGGVANYEITCNEGSFTISPKAITVEAVSYSGIAYGDSFTYRGGANNFANVEESGLVSGDSVIITVEVLSDGASVYPNVGNYILHILPDETLVNGERDCQNYIFTYIDGSLEIVPRPITVLTNSDSKVYDGTPLYNYGYTTYYYQNPAKTGLLDGDELIFVSGKQIINAETGVENTCSYLAPESGNYVIRRVNYGTLTILQKDITVVLNDIPSVAYGNALTYSSGADNYQNPENSGVVDGEKLEVSISYFMDGSSVTPKNAGTYHYGLDEENSVIHMPDGTTMGLGNYNVTAAQKTASITKLDIEIALVSPASSVYNARAQLYGGAFKILSGSLAYSEQLTVGVFYYADAALTQRVSQPVNAGTYYIVFNPATSFADEEVCTLNYNIVCKSSVTFEITPKEVTIVLGDVVCEYNGREYDFTNAPSTAFKVNGLYGYDAVKRTVVYSSSPVINAGEYVITFDDSAFTLTRGITSNYYLDTSNSNNVLESKLTISKREITVFVNDRQIERTGNPVDPDDESFVSSATTGGAGFVASDESRLDYYFTYDGSTTPPASLGSYSVGVVFADDEVTANYDITVKSGTLTITGRIVEVTAVYTGGELIYDGNPVGLENFTFTSAHVGENLADDDKYGFADGDLSSVSAVYTFRLGGASYTNGNTPSDAGTYVVTVTLSGYDKEQYFVSYNSCAVTILPRTVTIETSSFSEEYSNSAPKGEPTITVHGLLPQDEDKFFGTALYLNDEGTRVTRYNAGEYVISATVTNNTGKQNYVVDNDLSTLGTLTITPRTIYVRPQSKVAEYVGNDLVIYSNEYEIFYGSLASGDRLSVIINDNVLSAPKTFKTVRINGVNVYDNFGGLINDNYDVYYSYVAEMGDEYSTSDFTGTLEFIQLTLYYQIIVPDGQQSFVYTGEKISVEYTGNGSSLYRDVTGQSGYEGTGLYGDHRIEVKNTVVGTLPGIYTEWLNLRIVDGSGKDVTRLYSLQCVNAVQSAVEIRALGLTVTFDGSVTKENIANGSAVTTSVYDGLTVLRSDLYTVTGFLDGSEHQAEIYVVEDGDGYKLYLSPYLDKTTSSRPRRSDVSVCYTLDSLTVGGMEVSLLSYYDVEDMFIDY